MKKLFVSVGILVSLLSSVAFAHEDRNNVRHWHNGGSGGDLDIYIEEYPNGTTWLNQDGKRYVFLDNGKIGLQPRIDCQEAMAECLEALEAAKKSGEPKKTKTSLYYDGKPESATNLNELKPVVKQHLMKLIDKNK